VKDKSLYNIAIVISIIIFIILSGCMGTQPKGTPEPISSPSPSPSPIPTTETNVNISNTPVVTAYTPTAIRVTSMPNRVVENTDFTIKWEVSGGMAGNIDKTEIVWDFKKGNATDYSYNTTSMTGKTPMEFTGKLKIPNTSTIYFRAHAIVDGKEIFSDESQLTIYPEYTSGY